MEPSGQRHFVLSALSVALALSPVCALAVLLKTDRKFSQHSLIRPFSVYGGSAFVRYSQKGTGRRGGRYQPLCLLAVVDFCYGRNTEGIARRRTPPSQTAVQ